MSDLEKIQSQLEELRSDDPVVAKLIRLMAEAVEATRHELRWLQPSTDDW